jgi:hypothetical protein
MFLLHCYVVSALVTVAFGGMSHDLWHNSLQKPIGNQYDRPEENEGFDLKPPLSAGGNKFSILYQYYPPSLNTYSGSWDTTPALTNSRVYGQ